MSSDGHVALDSNGTSTAVRGVGFNSVGRGNAESSSRAASRASGSSSRSSAKRSSGSPTPETERSEEKEQTPSQDALRSSVGSKGRRDRRSGGFLLDNIFPNGSATGVYNDRGKRKAQDGQLHVEKRKSTTDRLSTHSSLRGSPLSREVSMGDGPADEREGKPTSRQSSMDAAQLVRMALDLSESRKRHSSNSLRVPSGSERGYNWALASSVGTVRVPSATQGQSVQSNEFFRASLASNRSADGNSDQPSQSLPSETDNVFYTFTPATLARAEKARKYFELASNHRRLLQTLPPLMPNPSTALGRSYNPIQSLRNRRVRIREKRPFPALPEAWVDVDKVKGWVDNVESAASMDYDASAEDFQIPPFAGESEAIKSEPPQSQAASRHRRTDTVGSVITRPENSWTIEPTELLADVYWTEHGDNKAFIETRKGDLLLPNHRRHDVSTPKISVDLVRDTDETFQRYNGASFDESERPSRRRRLMLPLPNTDKVRYRNRPSRASSTSSTSSKGRRSSGMLLRRESDENVGPLERHMQELIAQDAKGELSSPETSSPEQWARFKPIPDERMSIDGQRRKSMSKPDQYGKLHSTLHNGSKHHSRAKSKKSLEIPRRSHIRSRSADGRFDSFDRSASSLADSPSEPGSPQVTREYPSMGMDLALPSEDRGLPAKGRPRGPTLPSFQARTRDRNQIEGTDFADATSNALSPIPSAGIDTPVNGIRPDYFKRHRVNDSWTGLKRIDTGTTFGSSKDSTAGNVGRFFKSRRDKMFKGRDKLDAGDLSAWVSDRSDAEDSPQTDGPSRILANGDASDEESVRGSFEEGRAKPKFHLNNLPSFTSSQRDKRPALRIETPGLLKDDPFSRLDRPSRGQNHLAPPNLSFTQSNNADGEPSLTTRDESTDTRKSYGDLHPLFGEIPSRRLLTGAPNPGIGRSKRHWSIYDKASALGQQDAKITVRDIARARALLLCSGIQAREIARKADHPRSGAQTAYLAQAAATAKQSLPATIPYKEEHTLAARLLTTHLENSLSALSSTVAAFRSGPGSNLNTELENLRNKASDHLSQLAHETSDDADAFILELNSKTPQQIKRVDDAVDEMLRRRRRQLRMLKVAGFKVLEWVVVVLLWWIWFLVVSFKLFRRVVMGVWKGVRWVVTF